MSGGSVPVHIGSPRQLGDFIDLRVAETIKEAKKTAERIAKTEMRLAEFELLYSAVVGGEESKKNLSLLRKHREAGWKKAVEVAGGDEEKALFIYDL